MTYQGILNHIFQIKYCIIIINCNSWLIYIRFKVCLVYWLQINEQWLNLNEKYQHQII